MCYADPKSMLTKTETKELVDCTISCLLQIRDNLKQLEHSEAFRNLGYGSVRKCIKQEFRLYNIPYLYQQLRLSRIESMIDPKNKYKGIPDLFLRNLERLKHPSSIRKVWKKVIKIARKNRQKRPSSTLLLDTITQSGLLPTKPKNRE